MVEISENNLKSRLRECMDDYDEESVEGQKYDFHLGDFLLSSDCKNPVKISELIGKDVSNAVVKPGETVFVLTKEFLHLPSNVALSLLPKRKLSHKGINVLGGTHVDPNYEGQLVIGLHNFSSQDFNLQPGKKLISCIATELKESIEHIPHKRKKDTFPDELISMISNYKPIDTKELEVKIANLEQSLQIIKNKMDDDSRWQETMKVLHEQMSKDIDALKESLIKEREERIANVGNLDKRVLQEIQNITKSFNGTLWKVAGLTVAIIGGILVYLF